MRQWYRIVAKVEEAVADLYVYDEIGQSFWEDDSVSAKQFIADLRAIPEAITTLRVHVNSPGGDVFDAVTIANALRSERDERGRTVEVRIEGLAASAATIVSSAGHPIKIADNALVMVHNPSALVMGEASDMREMADALDAVRQSIIATYRWVSDLSEEALSALIDASTWMDAATAVANGFATEIIERVPMAASFRPDVRARLGEVPEPHRAIVNALIAPPPVPPTPPVAASASEVLRLCREGECLDLAESLVNAQATTAEVQAKVAEARTQRAAAEARRSEIVALCATAKVPELADGYVRGAMAIADIKAHLTTITARMDGAVIATDLDPNHGAPTAPRIDVAAVYATRNQQSALRLVAPKPKE